MARRTPALLETSESHQKSAMPHVQGALWTEKEWPETLLAPVRARVIPSGQPAWWPERVEAGCPSSWLTPDPRI